MKTKWIINVLKTSVLLLPVLVGCARGKITPTGEGTVLTQKGILEMGVNWIKDKSDKYDIEMRISNINDKSFIILLNDMLCYRGPIQGNLKHTFFNTGERTIDFKSGEVKIFRMVCDTHVEAKGPFKIIIKKVILDKDADGKKDLIGEVVLAKDMTWILESKE